ncbi:MAG: hypothetical protein K0Q97_2526, partial [Bacillota bacterium]|nr:hypothetical protein [Bacillota bacterium]
KNIILILFLLLLIIAAVIVYWQRDNISALINATKYSSEDLETKIDSNRENLQEELKNYTTKSIRDISVEDEQKLLMGEITLEEVLKKYNLPSGEKTDGNAATTNNANTIDDAVNIAVSEINVLKAEFISELGQIVNKAKVQYVALPKEKQNGEAIKQIVLDNIDYVAEIEKQYDNEVDDVLSNLKSELTRLNGDTAIVQTLRDSYDAEIEMKKSYYMNLFY